MDGKLDQATRASRIINSPEGELLKKSIEPEHLLMKMENPLEPI